MITRIRAFGAFWYNLIIGDDWRVALAVVLALALTAGLGHAGIPAWWVLPVTVVVVLPWSLWHAHRRN